MLIGHHPIGSVFARSLFFTGFGVALITLGIGAIILVAAVVYSLVAWSWRPFVLALLLVPTGIIGMIPCAMVGARVQLWAFELFDQRSADLAGAIEKYSRVSGQPPKSVADLIPAYLPKIPTTGMAAQPEYRYQANAGPCAGTSQWHLMVSVPKFLDSNRLLLCPEQDYGVEAYPVMSRTSLGTWVYEVVDF